MWSRFQGVRTQNETRSPEIKSILLSATMSFIKLWICQSSDTHMHWCHLCRTQVGDVQCASCGLQFRCISTNWHHYNFALISIYGLSRQIGYEHTFQSKHCQFWKEHLLNTHFACDTRRKIFIITVHAMRKIDPNERLIAAPLSFGEWIWRIRGWSK